MRYKVSGAIAIPKASWGCAPVLPNRMQEVFRRAKQIIFPRAPPITYSKIMKKT